ncbi:hypothetical protein IE077_002188, partial [Cardiosporidium cionae]
LMVNGQAHRIKQDIMERKWLKDIFKLMNECIEEYDIESLHKICFILRRFVIQWCGEMEVLEVLFSDDIFLNLLKAFECTYIQLILFLLKIHFKRLFVSILLNIYNDSELTNQQIRLQH